ncbi:hypothetical protein LCGC14_1014750 [marine sediment metagenome]|uniref:DNA primase/polymerase bifunctional N-terminal domain-containing protein n=1 Tax=marine sediment metagenome TaxID=412755 RepID=A0A0F9NKQ3_9ZZZZ
MIPKQLHNKDFRFCLIRKQSKQPFEKEWEKKGYKFDDKKLLDHINSTGNYGVIGGYGRLRILDIDNIEVIDFYKELFNDTFQVKTGSGKLHIYFFSDYNTNHVLINNLGELRANNYQCVGVGSIHPSGGKYEILNDVPIKEYPKERILEILKPNIRDIATTEIQTDIKDTSGSGLEFRRVLAMIREKKSRNIIYKEMMNYRKWASSGDDYRQMTYNKAMDLFIQEQKKPKEIPLKKLSEEELKKQLKPILKKIIAILKKYMDLEQKDYLLIGIWIIGTYFHNSFRSYPYLFFNAMKGSGKSRALNLITKLSKEGIVLNSLTEAVLFRTTGTLGIDEFEGVAKKGNENLRELLNSAYKKTGKVYRMKKVSGKDGETQEVEMFEVYRPIIMANIWGMDDTLGDRCIHLILEKSVNPKIVKLVEDFEDNVQIMDIVESILKVNGHVGHCKHLQSVQQKWNDYIVQHAQHVHNVHNVHNVHIYNKINNTELLGRDLELFFPLFLISDLCGELDEMLKVSIKIVKERKEKDVYESTDVQVYDFIAQRKEEGFIKVNALTQDFRLFTGIEEKQDTWINTRWFGKSLKRLKLVKERKRSNGTLVILDIEKAKEKIKIFKEPEEEKKEEKIEQVKIK